MTLGGGGLDGLDEAARMQRRNTALPSSLIYCHDVSIRSPQPSMSIVHRGQTNEADMLSVAAL
jgi:hypothetical protein